MYHLFSCSIFHADHKNVFVIKFWYILEQPKKLLQKRTTGALKIFKEILIAITQSKIV